ncbi:hypothetical protein [Deinococcus sp. RM]|uniref:hypothetical protein n=1 Tax=Deinococcus sp. RM TaxID=2316359 RepID=UPI0011C23EC8|nr:hypothetical protein [Deinococcus sp. RM]
MLKRILPALLALAFIPTAKAGNMSDLTPSQVCLSISTTVDNQAVPELHRIAMVSISDRGFANEESFLFLPGDCRAVMTFILSASSTVVPEKYIFAYQIKLKLIGVQTDLVLDDIGVVHENRMHLEDVIIWQIQGMGADANYEALKIRTKELAIRYFERFLQDWNSQH